MDPETSESSSWEADLPEMARQHAELLGLIAALSDERRDRGLDASSIRAILSALEAHFAWEESEMEAWSFPDLGRHRKDHRLQLSNLRDLLKSVETGGEPLDVDFFRACTVWMERHVLSMDEELARFLSEREIWDLRRELQDWEFEERFQRLPA